MKDILFKYNNRLKNIAEQEFNELSELEEIRINLSAVYSGKYRGEKCIFKFLISKLPESDAYNQNFSDYLVIHSHNMLELSNSNSFPEIFESKSIELDGFTFLLIVEEFLPYSFFEGINVVFNNNNNNILQTCSFFLTELVDLYINSESIGFVSHRDLSFDNLMFDKDGKLKMIDLGSAKSESSETTHLQIIAPTKAFYSAPEFEDLHLGSKTNKELVRAEIYTVGLLTFSLANLLLMNELANKRYLCGIELWIKENKKNQNFNERLSETNKLSFINHVLLNIFYGNKEDKFFRLLKNMTEKSVSMRATNYNMIKRNLGRLY